MPPRVADRSRPPPCNTFGWDGLGNATSTCGTTAAAFGATGATGDYGYGATYKANSGVTLTEALTLASASATSAVAQNSFTATAGASISAASTVVDLWTINEGKLLRNAVNGAN